MTVFQPQSPQVSDFLPNRRTVAMVLAALVGVLAVVAALVAIDATRGDSTPVSEPAATQGITASAVSSGGFADPLGQVFSADVAEGLAASAAVSGGFADPLGQVFSAELAEALVAAGQ